MWQCQLSASSDCTSLSWLALISLGEKSIASELPVLVQHVDQLLREVDAVEVPFQMHYQASDLRALLQSTMHHPEKKVHSMITRVHKHMGVTSPALVAEVWPKIQSSLQVQYDRIAEQIKSCYPDVQLPLSSGQLQVVLSS